MGLAPFWIKNAIIVSQNDQRDIFCGHIRVDENGIISEIKRDSPQASRSPAEQTVDATGLVIVPGFVQTHIHLCQTLFRNLADDLELLDWLSKKIWRFEASHTEETLAVSAEIGILELLSTGTTCLLDMGTVNHTESILKAVKKMGIRASVGKCLMDDPQTTPDYLRDKTQVALKEAEAIFLKWNGKENDRIRVSFAPRFVISCTDVLLREVSKLAQKHGALIHTHASENKKEIEWVKERTGKDNIQCIHDLGLTQNQLVLAHCVWVNESEMELLRKTNTAVAHCPSANLKLASGIAQIPEMLQKGICVSLGADGAACNNQLSALQEMKLAALIQKPRLGSTAMPAQEVLDLATRNGAKALHWWDQIGSIEVGKKADFFGARLNLFENFVSYSKNKFNREAIVSSLVYSTPAHAIQWTYVDGQRVFDRAHFQFDSHWEKKVQKAQDEILTRSKKFHEN